MKNKKLFAILTLVCFMFTLMPVAAFAAAGDLDATTSAFVLAEGEDATINAVGREGVTETVLKVEARDNATSDAERYPTAAESLYVWATDENGARTSALNIVNAAPKTAAPSKIAYVTEIAKADLNEYVRVSFARGGVYTMHAGIGAAGAENMSDIAELTGAANVVITVIGDDYNPDSYTMALSGVNATTTVDAEGNKVYKIGSVTPNNITEEYTLEFAYGTPVKALAVKEVSFQADSSNITVTPKDTKTDFLGRIKFDLSASREGNYSIYVNVDGKVFVINVECGNTNATYIETLKQPTSLLAQYMTAAEFNYLENPKVIFNITDINGNGVSNADETENMFSTNPTLKAKHLFFVEKPAASALTNASLKLQYLTDGNYALQLTSGLNAEGKYVVKAILDNGAVATAEWEVKRFATPVSLIIDAPTTVELGKSFTPDLVYVDANGVTKTATDAKLAATGYAIDSFVANKVTVKTDEKYAGAVVKLAAASELYDLVGTKEVKIAADATDIAFAVDTLAVNANNKVVWNVVDAEGNIVKLEKGTVETIKYVVLDKPVDAKVSVYDLTTKGSFDGDGKMAITSNKVGNVTVQVIAQVKFGTANAADNRAVQTKFYTGTQIFAVGTEGVGDVVVMSIGSNEIVINDAKGTIDAAPIVENNRTFVPFRALAEAFGATVAYDEATQAVTAELNGVTVVMTLGSAEYTVNGEAKTADVAPFINGSRTMVPVRFAAEAFGIKVIPTYDENGATADILFNL